MGGRKFGNGCVQATKRPVVRFLLSLPPRSQSRAREEPPREPPWEAQGGSLGGSLLGAQTCWEAAKKCSDFWWLACAPGSI